MGTTYRIKHVGDKVPGKNDIDGMLAELDRELSTWRDDSWISEFNRAPAGTTMDMPGSVIQLLERSKKLCDGTDGCFDPTIGALIRVWGFGAWRNEWRGEPDSQTVAAAREASGFHNLRIEGKQITKHHGSLMLDFSGIAQGYAVDLMGEMLRDAGCNDFIIEFGGEVLANGHAPGKTGWTVYGPALETPVTLHNEAAATSGSEHQHRGEQSHVIDPRTGYPVKTGPPVTVTAATCAEADALATARLVMEGTPIPAK
jgi:thiamine biosynthesis lipoprotein